MDGWRGVRLKRVELDGLGAGAALYDSHFDFCIAGVDAVYIGRAARVFDDGEELDFELAFEQLLRVMDAQVHSLRSLSVCSYKATENKRQN